MNDPNDHVTKQDFASFREEALKLTAPSVLPLWKCA
jgi:hypothetical protein